MPRRISALIALFAFSTFLHAASAGPGTHGGWSPERAAAYLDQRIEWWKAWPPTHLAQGGVCMSCHTALPYALARPRLRALLGERTPSADERALLNSVIQRVRGWNAVTPYYNDRANGAHKTIESRGTEAVLNALVLAGYDAYDGGLGGDTQTAFRNLWALQRTDGKPGGSWWWLQFGNEPFEGHDSDYYGAALAAVAVGAAPEKDRSTPEFQRNLDRLGEYLNREYAAQSPINHVVVLWASAKWPKLLAPERKRSILDEIFSSQRGDGGWNLASLAWTWRDWTARSLFKMFARSYGTPLQGRSDGYATALIAFTLQEAGIHPDEPHLSRALAWLVRNQDRTDGRWPGYSLNRKADPNSTTGLFMSDAATSYAVLALSGSN